ncbi:helix-turn-helix domain-containing protein [Paraburkholderia sp. JHI2823]|uniref:helix-turn-helix domain-containing protein n=1 Tax=Paraburkholderia sp. JHI2823 TaxID=3112960 RepID=UPI00317F3A8C
MHSLENDVASRVRYAGLTPALDPSHGVQDAIMGRKGVEVVSSELEREQLLSMSRSRSLPHSLVRRAKIVLMAADSHTSQEIAPQCEVTPPAITHWKKRFVAHGTQAG